MRHASWAVTEVLVELHILGKETLCLVTADGSRMPAVEGKASGPRAGAMLIYIAVKTARRPQHIDRQALRGVWNAHWDRPALDKALDQDSNKVDGRFNTDLSGISRLLHRYSQYREPVSGSKKGSLFELDAGLECDYRLLVDAVEALSFVRYPTGWPPVEELEAVLERFVAVAALIPVERSELFKPLDHGVLGEVEIDFATSAIKTAVARAIRVAYVLDRSDELGALVELGQSLWYWEASATDVELGVSIALARPKTAFGEPFDEIELEGRIRTLQKNQGLLPEVDVPVLLVHAQDILQTASSLLVPLQPLLDL